MSTDNLRFKLINFNDFELISHYLHKTAPSICELSMVNLFIWEDFDRPSYTLINGNLCILINPLNEAPYFLEPIGGNKTMETIEDCLQYAEKFSRTSEPFITMLPQHKFFIKCLRSQSDYIYLTKALAELKGRIFDGKRNHIKRFQNAFPDYKFTALQPDMKDAALSLFEKWFAKRTESRFFSRLAHSAQRKAIEKAFKYFLNLKLLGGALFVNGDLIGYTLGSRLNKDTAAVHFLYAEPAIHGAAQTLLWEASKQTFHAFTYLNLEQDLGIPGIRQFKLSYHPHHIERKFEIKFLQPR